MSRNTPVEGGMPYLYNPRNGRVMVATAAKAARRDEHDRPYFVPCMLPSGPDGTQPKINKGADSGKKPVIENYQKGKEETVEVSTTDDLMAVVMASEDKDELVQIGVDVGLKLTKTMKVETMQKRLSKHMEELKTE